MSYKEHVLHHYEEPYHKCSPPTDIEHTSFGYGHVSSNCGDRVEMLIRVSSPNIIQDIWWGGSGCCFAMSAASMLAGHFEGSSLEDVYTFSKEDMLKLFGAPCPFLREDCVLTSYHALKKLPRSLTWDYPK